MRGVRPKQSNRCKFCKASLTYAIEDSRRGQIICNQCGTVVDYQISDGAEWRTFKDEKGGTQTDRNRVGSRVDPLSLGHVTSSERTRLCDDGKKKVIGRQSSASTMDKTLMAARSKIGQIGSRLSLEQNLQHHALVLFREYLLKKKSIKSRSMETLAAACLFLSNKKHMDDPLDLETVRATCSLRERQLRNYIKDIRKVTNYKIQAKKPLEIVPELIKDLKLPAAYAELCVQVVEVLTGLDFMRSKRPSTIAALGVWGVLCEVDVAHGHTRKHVDGDGDVKQIPVPDILKNVASAPAQSTLRSHWAEVRASQAMLDLVLNRIKDGDIEEFKVELPPT